MLNNYTTLNTQAYEDLRYSLLVNVEERGDPKEQAYPDSKGIPTIGIGFNLSQQNIRDEILDTFDININAAAGSAERSYIDEITTISNQSWLNNTAGLQTALDDVMARRAADPAVPGTNKRSTFAFSDDAEIRTVFDALIPDYEIVLDNWLARHNLGTLNDSSERVALLSLAYNSPAESDSSSPNYGLPELLGLSLRDAIQNNNRPAAWFEIRYRSNGGASSAGIAKRRYYESESLGSAKVWGQSKN
jgi:GH24 family phage-related lysozyme (muramidase)